LSSQPTGCPHIFLPASHEPLPYEQVEDINARFGVDIATSQPADVAAMYGLFLEWSIPKGDAPLTGQEPDDIRAFKEALGISDEEAAPVHLDVGRRFMRSSFESGSREATAVEKKVRRRAVSPQRIVATRNAQASVTGV